MHRRLRSSAAAAMQTGRRSQPSAPGATSTRRPGASATPAATPDSIEPQRLPASSSTPEMKTPRRRKTMRRPAAARGRARRARRPSSRLAGIASTTASATRMGKRGGLLRGKAGCTRAWEGSWRVYAIISSV